MAAPYIYKICPRAMWDEAETTGVFSGAPIDKADGYIHFSTASQVRETANLHFAGQDALVIVAFNAATFGTALVFEASRNGDLFPHLYAPLMADSALGLWPLPLRDDGTFAFPAGLPEQDDEAPQWD